MVQRKYMKGVIRALNNSYRYDFVMSTFEVLCKLHCRSMRVDVWFPSHHYRNKEEYGVNEETKVGELFRKIKQGSKHMKEWSEKGLYWVYFVDNENASDVELLKYERKVVEVIGSSEECINTVNEVNGVNKRNGCSLTRSVVVDDDSEGDNNDNARNSTSMLNVSEYDLIYNETRSFRLKHFEIRRRLFSPQIITGDILKLPYTEQECLFHQIKNTFYTSNVVDYTWRDIGEQLSVLCYFELLSQNKRDTFITRSNINTAVLSMKDIENLELPLMDPLNSAVINSSGKAFTNELIEYPKNLCKGEAPLTSLSVYERIRKEMKQLKDPKRMFFRLSLTCPLLYSNVYEVRVAQCSEMFPEKCLISLTLDKAQLLYRRSYRVFFEFAYHEVVKCALAEPNAMLLVVNVANDDDCYILNNDEDDQRYELAIQLESPHSRFIVEDILSYSQLYLATHTTSTLVAFSGGVVNLKSYELVYQRALVCERLGKAVNADAFNEMEINQMRNSMHASAKYKAYKERKNKALMEEAERKMAKERRGEFDIRKIKGIPRYHEDVEDDGDEASDDEDEEGSDEKEVEVKKVVWVKAKEKEKTEVNEVDKEEERNVKVVKEDEKVGEVKEARKEAFVEEKERKMKEEEERVGEEKRRVNEEKRMVANENLLKAIRDLPVFDSEEEEEDEDDEGEYDYGDY
jgi:hypothetical protein